MNLLDELSRVQTEFDSGRTAEALAACLSLLEQASDGWARVNCAGVLIDLAAAAGRPDLVHKAIARLDEVRASLGDQCPAAVLYDLGNGWSATGQMELGGLPPSGRWTSRAFQRAKGYHRAALTAAAAGHGETRVEYIVNLANTLDSLGRHLEAVEEYDSALALDGDFGMALCNKAMAIQFFAGVSETYRDALYIWAWQMLRRGLADPRVGIIGGPAARQEFESRAARIENRAVTPDVLSVSLDHPPADLSSLSEFERRYVTLCAAEHLFLNVHVHDHACSAAITDNIFIRPPRPPLSEHFVGLAQSLNQIIEDFSAARCLWVLAQCEDSDVLSAGARTLLPRVAGTGASLQYGLMKASFRLGFDVLDKLAGFLNDYLRIGLPPHRVGFTNARRDCLWWGDPGNRVLRPEVEAAFGGSLGALYDIFLDFQINEATGIAHYQRLRDMRNTLTHRRLPVAIRGAGAGQREVDFGVLVVTTREMLFLVRCAVMYLILFANSREHRGEPRE
jgi:tetratricopeptide (TPR) repeat protein